MDVQRPGRFQTPIDPRVLCAAAVALLLLEVAAVSFSFDARALLAAGDPDAWQRVLGQFGNVAKIGVLTLALGALLFKGRLSLYLPRLLSELTVRRFLVFSGINLIAYWLFFLVTSDIFGAGPRTGELTSVAYIAWLTLGLATLGSWALSLSAPRILREFIRAESGRLLVALGIASVVWILSVQTQRLWGPLSAATFKFSASLLASLAPESLVINLPSERLLGLGDFIVDVAPACSGYEGIALISAFTASYLFIFRQELLFPRAYLLFAIGAGVIWLLNSVRIATLIAIGHYWSPAIAIGGFHSQAGWLTFIFSSLLILWLIDGTGLFRRSDTVAKSTSLNLAVATLIPIVALLATSLLTALLAADFDWLYPLRVCAVVIALCYVWPSLGVRPHRFGWEPLAAGVLVGFVWIVLVGSDEAYNRDFVASLSEVPRVWAALWLFFRFLGACLTVPVAEELAFRGYLLARLSKSDAIVRGPLPFSLFAVAVSSLAFGVLHSAWVAGTIAGVVYALVRLRSASTLEAMIAHAVTNVFLFIVAVTVGNWSII